MKLAEAEGMNAHALAVKVRKQYSFRVFVNRVEDMIRKQGETIILSICFVSVQKNAVYQDGRITADT